MHLPKTASLCAVLALVASAGLSETWYPAGDWKDTDDPVASPRAKKGGVLRFDGSSAPNSFNAYIDTSSYVQMMFSLMYPMRDGYGDARLRSLAGGEVVGFG